MQSKAGVGFLKTQPPKAIHTGAEVGKVFFVLGLIDAANRYFNQGKQTDANNKAKPTTQ